MEYRGWTIFENAFFVCAILQSHHDESGNWEIHADTVEEIKELIDERVDR